MAVRVFVVDDSDVFLDAVREVLEACPDFELVGQAHTGEAAIAALSRMAPDLVLVDVQLPGIDGPETARQIESLSTSAFVILCSVGEDPRCGASFLPKARISPSTLRAAWQHRTRAVADTASLPVGG
jgi:DNA-binding NarL/FixJ family response regulator